MPRRKQIDATPVIEAFLTEVDFRVTRAVNEALRDIERRLDRIEKRLAGEGGRPVAPRTYKVCSKAGCSGRVIAHGLCSRHYQQWRYHRKKKGDEEIAPAKRIGRAAARDDVAPRKSVTKRKRAPRNKGS